MANVLKYQVATDWAACTPSATGTPYCGGRIPERAAAPEIASPIAWVQLILEYQADWTGTVTIVGTVGVGAIMFFALSLEVFVMRAAQPVFPELVLRI